MFYFTRNHGLKMYITTVDTTGLSGKLQQNTVIRCFLISMTNSALYGATENAGVENAGVFNETPFKCKGL